MADGKVVEAIAAIRVGRTGVEHVGKLEKALVDESPRRLRNMGANMVYLRSQFLASFVRLCCRCQSSDGWR